MDAFQLIASEAVINIALGTTSLLAAYATYGIHKLTEKAKAQTKQITEETTRQKFESAVSDVDRLAAITVSAIEQTTAKTLREAVRDGKVDRMELEALAIGAKKKIMNAVSTEAKQIIAASLGSFDDYVGKLIEDRVRKIKMAPGEQEA